MPKSGSIVLALFFLLYPISAFPGTSRTAEYVPGELLVKFREGLAMAHAQSIHRSLGSNVIEELKGLHIERIEIPAGWSVEEAISFYSLDPDVEYAEPNYIRRALMAPNDPYFNELSTIPGNRAASRMRTSTLRRHGIHKPIAGAW
jgi:thermitase